MASTIYKGDLAEVTFGHECGLSILHGAFGGGAVTAVATSPTTGGSGYAAATVVTTGGSGTGATVAISAIANGVASTASVDDAGASYANGNAVTQSGTTGGGSGFAATVDTVAGGAVTAFTITAGGSGHAVNDVITMTGGAGSGLKFVVTAILNGVITSLTATPPAGGDGYLNTDVLTLGGSGTGGTVAVNTAAGGLVFTKSDDASNDDCTKITFTGASAGYFDASGNLKMPAGMLVGSTLRVIGANGGNYANDDYTDTGNVYTIVANSANIITVTPKMKSNGASSTGDELIVDTIGTPTMDTAMSYNANPTLSDESVLTDQFIGLAATIALPETKVEVRRSHVIGLGRDVVIQEPQKITNEGGSMEMMFNSARWMYYALGSQVIDVPTGKKTTPSGMTHLDISAGDVYLEYTGTMANEPSAGEYIIVSDTTALLFPTDVAEPSGSKWGDGVNLGTTMQHAERNEIRRVLYHDATTTTRRIYVDEPFSYDHALGNITLEVVAYHESTTDGSPNFDSTSANFGKIENLQKRLIFQGPTVPSFTIESSLRTRNSGSFNASGGSEAAPGSASDNKQLTRIWRGCKVKDFSLAADADAEVKLSINFDALYCYTDTGRLEEPDKGDRYSAHRMFENIANGKKQRKVAGIAPNTEKPYFFYNGSVSAFGANIAQITNFNLTGNNNIENMLTIRGSGFNESRNSLGQSLEQVPFGGSRSPNLSIEKQVEYECKLSLIVSDPLLWHEYRTNRTHGHTEPITLTLTKAGAHSDREKVIIVIDDYIISEAPLPIPEDKGPIKSDMTIMPKHVRVISHDAFLGL